MFQRFWFHLTVRPERNVLFPLRPVWPEKAVDHWFCCTSRAKTAAKSRSYIHKTAD